MKYIKLFILVLIFTFVFSGCNDASRVPTQITDVCVLLGDFSNAKDADLSVISSCIDPAINANVNFTIYVLDGEPDDQVYTCEYNNGNRIAPDIIRDHYNKFLKNDLTPQASSAIPNQKETDILSGLYMAEKHLSKSEADYKKIIIFSTGIPTAGYINFNADSTVITGDDKQVDSLIRNLKVKNYLPDLNGIEIQWYNLCETKMPQTTPSRPNKVKIESFWTKILKSCGVEEGNIKFDYSILDSNDSDESVVYPSVTPILFKNETIEWDFPDEVVKFNPGEATFCDEDAVYATLKPYAQRICEAASKKFIIVGSTATYGDKEECLKLSLKRAEAVKKVLCDYGVPGDVLMTYGVGQNKVGDDLTKRVLDIDEDGRFIEKKGKLNRKVMVVDTSTSLGKQLLDELGSKQ